MSNIIGSSQCIEKGECLSPKTEQKIDASYIILKGLKTLSESPQFAKKYAFYKEDKSGTYNNLIMPTLEGYKGDAKSPRQLAHKAIKSDPKLKDLFRDLRKKIATDKAKQAQKDAAEFSKAFRERIGEISQAPLPPTAQSIEDYKGRFGFQSESIPEDTEPMPVEPEVTATEEPETVGGDSTAKIWNGLRLTKFSIVTFVSTTDPCFEQGDCKGEHKIVSSALIPDAEKSFFYMTGPDGSAFGEIVFNDDGGESLQVHGEVDKPNTKYAALKGDPWLVGRHDGKIEFDKFYDIEGTDFQDMPFVGP